jgi:hypothetical protein
MPLGIFYAMSQIAGFVILLFAALLLIVSSVTYQKEASAAAECPSGQAKDWA